MLATSIDRGRLSAADRSHLDLFARAADEALRGRRFRMELMPLSQMEGVQQQPAQLLTMMPASSPARNTRTSSPVSAGVPTLVDQTIALMREGLAAGLTPPRITLRDVPQQVRNQIVDDPLASPMLRRLQRFPETVGRGRPRAAARGRGRGLPRRQSRPRTAGCSRSSRPSTSRDARVDRAPRDLPDGAA